MRMVLLHCDWIEYTPLTKAIKNPEKVESNKTTRVEEPLVAMISVEKDDEGVINEAVNAIEEVANEVKAKRIVVYPWAHLSSNLASPSVALDVLKRVEKRLSSRGWEVVRAPFGWYKSFSLRLKGHPLSELSREIKATKEAAKEKRKGKKKYVILTPDGKEIRVSKGMDLSAFPEEFQILVRREALEEKSKEGESLAPILNRFGFEWEPLSDYGHMRYRPLAAQLFDTVAEYARQVCRKVGVPVFEVKGTAFFDLEIPAVKEHAKLYGDRLYMIETDKGEFVLRYAACHQQFAMIKDWIISRKDLPFGALEIADSYRYEQRGETTLSFRLRRFFMPDFHIFVENEESAKKLGLRVHDVIVGAAGEIGRQYDLLVNVVNEETYKKYKGYILDIVKKHGRPALVAIYPTTGANYYWTINIEYVVVDISSRPREIGTFQIDIGNSQRFGITYLDGNERKYPTIIHIAIIGSIERYIYLLMDTAKRRKKPVLPFWAAPIQIRVIPVAGEYVEFAKEIKDALSSKGLRVDVDDTENTLGKKIRNAERLWIPLTVIVGGKEKESGVLTIRDRYEVKEKKMKLEELEKYALSLQGDKPQRPMYFPDLVSRQAPMYGSL